MSGVSEARDAIWCGHPWRHLCEGCHWGVDDWVHTPGPGESSAPPVEGEPPGPLMAALSSAYCTGKQGLRLQGSLLQLFQGPLELQVDDHSDVTGRLHGIGQRRV